MSLIVGAYYLTPDGDKIRLEMIAKTGINQDIENSNDICIFELKGRLRSLESFNFESVMKRTNSPPTIIGGEVIKFLKTNWAWGKWDDGDLVCWQFGLFTFWWAKDNPRPISLNWHWGGK